ncbi:hypothetical protein [Marichromatium gracile]|uniref:YtxH-like protein n=1 Tax=Marichromatium gracile TaxID=1048 RepID=A0ABR5VDJ1_MARGR|nr:hypothetical protein [Marichromatium gracile]KXX63771.1 hypothetical protein AY586_03600 [Marichromatium gracile]
MSNPYGYPGQGAQGQPGGAPQGQAQGGQYQQYHQGQGAALPPQGQAYYYQGYHAPMAMQQPQWNLQNQQGTLATLSRDRFLKGLVIGAAATYLLTNEQVQRTAINGMVRAWAMVQGGVEEIKERFGDAEAELRHASQRQDP